MREPLPLACLTSAAYADAAPRRPRSRGGRPRRVGVELDTFDQEDREPEHQLVLGGVRTFDELLAERRRAPTSAGPAGTSETTPLRPLRAPAVGRPARRTRSARDRDDRAPFDVCGPLPTGVTVLEASAGTGKTYTIAALAARYVAEGMPLDRAAARHVHADGDRRAARARARAARQRRARARARAGRRAADGATRSCGCSPTGRRARSQRRRDRLARALADFDAATIATTHGFCQEVLGGLGVAGDVEPRQRRSSRTSATSSRRSSTTSTCAASTASDDAAVQPRARRCRSRAIAVDEPGGADRAARRARGRAAGDAPRGWRDARPRRARACASSALAVMTYDDLLTRLDDDARGRRRRGRRARGCASATASCSSTSSRTPTRPVGASCGARSATAARRSS